MKKGSAIFQHSKFPKFSQSFLMLYELLQTSKQNAKFVRRFSHTKSHKANIQYAIAN